MIRGLYTATTGMMVERNKMDVLTNNIVNAETTGYKSDKIATSAFDKVMLERINDPNVSIVGTNAGPYSWGTHVDEKVTDFTEGTLEETGRSTDLAISGGGFFTVETDAGDRYTRNGNFVVNSEGYLTTEDGNYVLGQSGRVWVGDDGFTVADDGTVTASDGTTNKLSLAGFDDTAALRKQGDNLYYLYGGAAPHAATGSKVYQGMQESSNVSAADSMVNMMSVYRKYEACQRVVTMNDETLGLAVNKIGSLE